jgi:hypothetical protein
MRISTIALATAFALSGTVALAQDAGGMRISLIVSGDFTRW